jgi:hypothetical protein
MDVKNHFGIVAILDALGISSLDASAGVDFIESRDKALEKAKKYAETVKEIQQSIASKLSIVQQPGDGVQSSIDIYTTVNPVPNILSINDTIIFHWPIELFKDDDKDDHLIAATINNVAELLSYFLATSFFDHSIKYRGTLSLGKYANIDNRSIMGRAVSDAASFYSFHDHIGLVVSPNGSAYIDQLIEGNHNCSRLIIGDNRIEPSLHKTSIRMKNGCTLPLWTIPWPVVFATLARADDNNLIAFNPRKFFIALLWSDNPPIEAQQKCFQALEYYDLCQSCIKRPTNKES